MYKTTFYYVYSWDGFSIPKTYLKLIKTPKCPQMLPVARKWSQILPNAPKCFHMLLDLKSLHTLNSFKLSHMLPNAVKCSHMLANASKCFLNAPCAMLTLLTYLLSGYIHAPKCFPRLPHAPECLQMLANASKYYQMLPNASKFSQMLSNASKCSPNDQMLPNAPTC